MSGRGSSTAGVTAPEAILEMEGLPILKFLKNGLGVSGSEAVRSIVGRCARPRMPMPDGIFALVGEPRGDRSRAGGGGDLIRVGEWPNSFRGGGERAFICLGGGDR